MNKPPFGMPGPGGSLGTCAVCGKDFLLEIMMGRKVLSIELDAFQNTFFVHKDCRAKIKDGMAWEELPEESPLRHASLKAIAEQEAKNAS